jgi:hypothetical protein
MEVAWQDSNAERVSMDTPPQIYHYQHTADTRPKHGTDAWVRMMCLTGLSVSQARARRRQQLDVAVVPVEWLEGREFKVKPTDINSTQLPTTISYRQWNHFPIRKSTFCGHYWRRSEPFLRDRGLP